MNSAILKLLRKKFITAIFSSSILLTGFTIFIIWFYLINLERLDIFLDTTSIGSTLVVIFFFIVLAILAFSMLFFISSFMLMLTYNSNKDSFNENVGAAHCIGSTCFINSILICGIVISGYSLYYFNQLNGFYTAISTFILIIISNSITTHFKIMRHKNTLLKNPNHINKFHKHIWMTLKLSIKLIIPGAVQLLPLIFFITQISFSRDSNTIMQTTALVILSTAFITTGILPGSIYINEQEKGFSLKSIAMLLIPPPLIIIVVSMIFHPIPSMIANMAMNLSGISDWRIHQYYIIENNLYHHNMFNGRLWNTRYYQDIPNRFFITGVNVFSLGNKKLICPTTIIEPMKQSLKDNPLESEERNKRMNILEGTAMKCIPFDKDDIHAWDSPIPAPIYYEKVQLAPENPGETILQMLK
ncbi:hypothetical protein M8Q08_16770 [Enterobacter hormaechei]|nr:hypothetical protein [Enterobacter hormaechei]MCM7286494.1 hypothetical protein [Enterobacter hormaechei]